MAQEGSIGREITKRFLGLPCYIASVPYFKPMKYPWVCSLIVVNSAENRASKLWVKTKRPPNGGLKLDGD